MSAFCPWCGNAVSPEHRYCRSCGRELASLGGRTTPEVGATLVGEAEGRDATREVTRRKQRRQIIFIVVALAVMAIVLYIVLKTEDLTALLLGILVIVFIYALARFSVGRS